jgi:hypothetical protein
MSHYKVRDYRGICLIPLRVAFYLLCMLFCREHSFTASVFLNTSFLLGSYFILFLLPCWKLQNVAKSIACQCVAKRYTSPGWPVNGMIENNTPLDFLLMQTYDVTYTTSIYQQLFLVIIVRQSEVSHNTCKYLVVHWNLQMAATETLEMWILFQLMAKGN